MNNPDCPYYESRRRDEAEIMQQIADETAIIEADMRALGLKPENMRSLVRMAAILGVKARRLQIAALLTDATYIETSREGNEKPVSQPIHAQAASAATAYNNALKQLGINANVEKVSTRVAEPETDDSPLAKLMSEMGQQ